jgi:hypothetical protein
VATVWRFTVGGTSGDGSQEWNSTMHYQTDTGTLEGEPGANDVLDTIRHHYGSGGAGDGMERWLAIVPATVKLTFVRVYEELAPGSTAIAGGAETTSNFSGNVAVIDAGLPFALCPWVKFTTGIASRSSRGGSHLAPTIDQNHFGANGLFDTTLSYWSAIVDLANHMKESLSIGGSGPFEGSALNPVIYSRTRRERELSPYTFRITGASPSQVPRFLRRRDVGR